MSFADLARNCNFRALFTASACTNLGDGLLAVAFPWFATLLTRDPVLVGAATVSATGLSQGRHKKVSIFKMRRRKHYQRASKAFS